MNDLDDSVRAKQRFYVSGVLEEKIATCSLHCNSRFWIKPPSNVFCTTQPSALNECSSSAARSGVSTCPRLPSHTFVREKMILI